MTSKQSAAESLISSETKTGTSANPQTSRQQRDRHLLINGARSANSVWASAGSLLPKLMAAQGARRLGWGIIDQGLSSLTNLLVSLSVARMLGAEQFGAFSLAYVTYGFILTASRALATDPLIVRFGGSDIEVLRKAVSG